jgi:hypothetical protein
MDTDFGMSIIHKTTITASIPEIRRIRQITNVSLILLNIKWRLKLNYNVTI